METLPIWKDFLYSLGQGNQYRYRIEVDGQDIYEGICHKRPGYKEVKIRLNDICADYIKSNFPNVNTKFTSDDSIIFKVYVYDEDDQFWEFYDSVSFYGNWSYDYDFNPHIRGLNAPINGRVAVTTPIPYTVLNAKRLDIHDGHDISSLTPSSQTKGTYMVSINSVGKVQLKDFSVLQSLAYSVVDFCGRYAIYYRNAYGGIDVFLIEGNHAETDSLERHVREIEYDNGDIFNRAKENYANQITKTLTLHTSWLTDQESLRMHHLLNSTEVYLYDTVGAQMIPIVLMDTQTQYKTYKSNGGKLVNYTINVAIAQERVRR